MYILSLVNAVHWATSGGAGTQSSQMQCCSASRRSTRAAWRLWCSAGCWPEAPWLFPSRARSSTLWRIPGYCLETEVWCCRRMTWRTSRIWTGQLESRGNRQTESRKLTVTHYDCLVDQYMYALYTVLLFVIMNYEARLLYDTCAWQAGRQAARWCLICVNNVCGDVTTINCTPKEHSSNTQANQGHAFQ